MSFFLFDFIKHLGDDLKRAYDKLNEAQKLSLQQGSGLIAIVNSNLDKTPAEIRALIQEKFPGIDESKLEQSFFEVAKSFNLAGFSNFTSIDDAIKALQSHLSSLQGATWEIASHAAASLLSILFAPPETKVSAIVSLIEWVYQHFTKKAV